MAADSSMGFHQGITASLYNHHMLSFQSNSDVGISGDATGAMVMAPGSVGGGSSNAGLFLSANTGVMGNAPGVAPSRTSSGDALLGTGTPKYKYVTGPPSDWSDREVAILKEGLVRYINSSFCFLNCFCLYSTVLFCSAVAHMELGLRIFLLLIWNLVCFLFAPLMCSIVVDHQLQSLKK
jgi:hypothetical protein